MMSDRHAVGIASFMAHAFEKRITLSAGDFLGRPGFLGGDRGDVDPGGGLLVVHRRRPELDRHAATSVGGKGEVASSAVLEGQADCLYELGHYDRALRIYQNQLYRRAATGSPVWWRAYLRSLHCHVELHAAPIGEVKIRQAKHALAEVLKSITARRQSQPELGGAALREQFQQLEKRVTELLAGMG